MVERRLKLAALGWMALWFVGLWIGGYSSPFAPNGIGILAFGAIVFGTMAAIAIFVVLWLLQHMFGIVTLVPFVREKDLIDR